MANDKIVNVDPDNFQSEVLEAELPVLVDFWATWCGPCRVVAPVLDQLADEWSGKVRVAKVDVDSAQQLAIQYQVSSIPTFILFKNGRVADRMMGNAPKPTFDDFIRRNA